MAKYYLRGFAAALYWTLSMLAIGFTVVKSGLIAFIDGYYVNNQFAYWTLFVVSRAVMMVVWILAAILFAQIAYKIGLNPEAPDFFGCRKTDESVSKEKTPLAVYFMGIVILLIILGILEMCIYGALGTVPPYMPLVNQILMESPH